MQHSDDCSRPVWTKNKFGYTRIIWTPTQELACFLTSGVLRINKLLIDSFHAHTLNLIIQLFTNWSIYINKPINIISSFLLNFSGCRFTYTNTDRQEFFQKPSNLSELSPKIVSSRRPKWFEKTTFHFLCLAWSKIHAESAIAPSAIMLMILIVIFRKMI